MDPKQKKIDGEVKLARFDVLRAKNYQALLEQPAWMELEQEWLEAIKAHETDKTSRSLFDYAPSMTHEWGHDKSGKALFITGPQLLEQQQLEELRIREYQLIMAEVKSRIQRGMDSAMRLKKHDETKTNK